MKVDSTKRTMVKTFSWRVFSLIITFSVTLAITGSTKLAVSISAIDNLIKAVTYFFHERYWTHIKWGRKKKKKLKKKKKEHKEFRSEAD